MDLYGSPSSGLSFEDFAVVPGNTIPTNSHFSKGRSLADSLKGLSSAGFVDFGVNSVDKVGSVRSELLILGADNKGTRQMDDGEIGQPNLAVMELKSGCGLPVLGASTMEEMALSEAVMGEEENLTVCNPLFTIIPPGLALTVDVHNDSEVLNIGNTLDVSSWVKNKIPDFCKVIGLSANRHEKLCIAYL